MVNVCKLVALLLVCSALLGCGGSSGGGGSVNRTRPVVDYAEYEKQSQALHDTWDLVSFTDPSTLPMSGSASYSGVIQLDVERGRDEVSLAGDMNIRVSFANNRVSGDARNFVDETDASYGGRLTLSNGVLDRGADPAVDYTLEADLTGTLSGAGEKFDVAADLSGDFHGAAAGAATGAIQGSADSSFGNGYVFGEFIVAQ